MLLNESHATAMTRRVSDLLSSIYCGTTSHSEYDAGWLARVPLPGHDGTPAHPEVLSVVQQTQQPDGGWGPEGPHHSAKILCTLSSMLALLDSEESRATMSRRIDLAAQSIDRAWAKLTDEPELTIGFELLAAPLLKQVCRHGLNLEHLLSHALKLQIQKLRHIPEDQLYSPRLSIGYSLEFLDTGLDLARAATLQVANGSIAGNIAATAYYARISGNPAALDYLQNCIQKWGPDNIPYGEPSDLFPRIWVLHHLRMADLITPDDPRVKPHLDALESHLGQWGMSWSTYLQYGDVDDTNLALSLLEWGQRHPDWTVLNQYETTTHFCTYFGENSPSTSANAHVLGSLLEFQPQRTEAIEKTRRFLLRTRTLDGYWNDKWHTSPYYTTSRAIWSLALYGDIDAVAKSCRWILGRQEVTGGWGFFGRATPEETSYCIHALVAWLRLGGTVPHDTIFNALRFLTAHMEQNWDLSGHPRFWINKTLYLPKDIVQSSVVGAVSMGIEALASLPSALTRR